MSLSETTQVDTNPPSEVGILGKHKATEPEGLSPAFPHG